MSLSRDRIYLGCEIESLKTSLEGDWSYADFLLNDCTMSELPVLKRPNLGLWDLFQFNVCFFFNECVSGVVGGGNFGTAIATLCARNEHHVLIYTRERETADNINKNHFNPKYLQKYHLSSRISATTDLDQVISQCCILFFALPAQQLPIWIKENKAMIREEHILCNTAKGLYVKENSLMSEAVFNALGRDNQPYCLLSGPSFAAEIMSGHPTSG